LETTEWHYELEPLFPFYRTARSSLLFGIFSLVVRAPIALAFYYKYGAPLASHLSANPTVAISVSFLRPSIAK